MVGVVVGASATHLATAITTKGVYCFHPRFTLAGETVVSVGGVPPPFLDEVPDNSHWTYTCLDACPSLRRKTQDDAGTMVFPWTLVEGSEGKWSIFVSRLGTEGNIGMQMMSSISAVIWFSGGQRSCRARILIVGNAGPCKLLFEYLQHGRL
jgi:hypothetical protein